MLLSAGLPGLSPQSGIRRKFDYIFDVLNLSSCLEVNLSIAIDINIDTIRKSEEKCGKREKILKGIEVCIASGLRKLDLFFFFFFSKEAQSDLRGHLQPLIFLFFDPYVG